MATDYPIEITDPDGSVRIAGLADFTDPDNAPAGTNQPFKPTPGGTVTVVEDAAGDPVVVYDDDAGKLDVTGKLNVSGAVLFAGDLTADGQAAFGTDASSVTGFYGANPVVQPSVPATPLPQDIVDALVSLGLVSQAS